MDRFTGSGLCLGSSECFSSNTIDSRSPGMNDFGVNCSSPGEFEYRLLYPKAGAQAYPIQQLTLQGRKERLAQGLTKGVADAAHGRTNTNLAVARAERPRRGVLAPVTGG